MCENRSTSKKFDRIVICRTSQTSKQSLGVGLCLTEKHDLIYQFRTLELPWQDNSTKTSRIPVGSYQCKKWKSPRHGNCFKIMSVVGRTDILIHKGNYHFDTLGCILVGDMLSDINNDNIADVINSGMTLKYLLSIAPDEFLIVVK